MKFEKSLKLVNIDIDYLKYLNGIDSNVYYDETNPNYIYKPHLGILINEDNIKYVIPLTSAKEKHKKWKDVSADYFRVYEIIDTRTDNISESDIIVDIKNKEILDKIDKEEQIFYKQKILSVLDIRKMFPVAEAICNDANMSIGIDVIQNRRTALQIKELLFLKNIKTEIEEKATKIYEKQKKTKKVLKNYNNFQKLEDNYLSYINEKY